VYPPELHWQPDMPVANRMDPGFDGYQRGEKESQITAILMSREQRSTAGKSRLKNPSGLIGPESRPSFCPQTARRVRSD